MLNELVVFGKKLGSHFFIEMAKKSGANCGNNKFNRDPHKKELSIAQQSSIAGGTVKFITSKHDWDEIDANALGVSKYVELLAPVAATTVVAYMTLPVVSGAATFALLGTGASTVAYIVSNVGVLVGGAYAGGKRVAKNIKPKRGKDGAIHLDDIPSDSVYK